MVKGKVKVTTFLIVGLSITALVCTVFAFEPKPLRILDLKLYDLLFHLRGQKTGPDSVVIAAIDEKSIEQLGRWPWNRDKFAKLIDRLVDFNVAVVAFDVIFSEPEERDPILTESIDRAGNVIMPVVFFFDDEQGDIKNEIIRSSLRVTNHERLSKYAPLSSRGVLMPVPSISEVSSGFGHINAFPDEDGVIRVEALYVEYQGYLIPSLALKAASLFLGIPEDRVVIDATKGVYLGKRYIPTDQFGRILIPYYGGNNSFKHISIVDILEGRVKREELEERLVFIGATAVGIYDLRVTPFSSALPGVEKHASVASALIEGVSIVPAGSLFIYLSVIIMGVLSTLVYYRFKATLSVLFLLLSLTLLVLFSYYLFLKGVWFSTNYASLSMILNFTALISMKYAYSEREARNIRKIFSNYVTERVVNELIKNPEMAKLGGERREVTVLFSDIRGFTTLSEKTPPEQVVELLNEYFDAMTKIIFKWEGTLDKFIGDAIMVFWGAPLPQPDHAERAVNCSLEMVAALRTLSEKWLREGKPELKIGIGINTGEVLVGNIGAEGRKMDYTVIGDHVNLASRLEGLNKKFGTEIIISEFTLEKLKEQIEQGKFNHALFRGLGNIAVKGKERPVKIYSVEQASKEASGLVEVSDDKVIVMTEK